VEYADGYHADRGHDYWANLDTTTKQACLIRATDYLQKRFSRRWKGVRVSWSQSLDWPRLDIWDDKKLLLVQSNAIPKKLIQATCEYALRAAVVGELAPDPVPLAPAEDFSQPVQERPTEYQGGLVKQSLKKVGPIEKRQTYLTPDLMIGASRNKVPTSQLVATEMIPEYPAADLLLEDYLLPVSGKRVVRG